MKPAISRICLPLSKWENGTEGYASRLSCPLHKLVCCKSTLADHYAEFCRTLTILHQSKIRGASLGWKIIWSCSWRCDYFRSEDTYPWLLSINCTLLSKPDTPL